jgi:hypothetical protein
VYIQEDGLIDPECTKRTLKACEGQPFFGEHEGKRYCVLHFPDFTSAFFNKAEFVDWKTAKESIAERIGRDQNNKP